MTLKPRGAVGWISNFAKRLFWPSGFSGRNAQAEECWLAHHLWLCMQNRCQHWAWCADGAAESGTDWSMS